VNVCVTDQVDLTYNHVRARVLWLQQPSFVCFAWPNMAHSVSVVTAAVCCVPSVQTDRCQSSNTTSPNQCEFVKPASTFSHLGCRRRAVAQLVMLNYVIGHISQKATV